MLTWHLAFLAQQLNYGYCHFSFVALNLFFAKCFQALKLLTLVKSSNNFLFWIMITPCIQKLSINKFWNFAGNWFFIFFSVKIISSLSVKLFLSEGASGSRGKNLTNSQDPTTNSRSPHTHTQPSSQRHPRMHNEAQKWLGGSVKK